MFTIVLVGVAAFAVGCLTGILLSRRSRGLTRHLSATQISPESATGFGQPILGVVVDNSPSVFADSIPDHEDRNTGTHLHPPSAVSRSKSKVRLPWRWRAVRRAAEQIEEAARLQRRVEINDRLNDVGHAPEDFDRIAQDARRMAAGR